MTLTADTATNFNNMHLCIPLQIKKKTNAANDVDDGLTTVNNFFAHFIKEIDIRRYGDDIRYWQQTTLLTYVDILTPC